MKHSGVSDLPILIFFKIISIAALFYSFNWIHTALRMFSYVSHFHTVLSVM